MNNLHRRGRWGFGGALNELGYALSHGASLLGKDLRRISRGCVGNVINDRPSLNKG
jgi:hypothetical protein